MKNLQKKQNRLPNDKVTTVLLVLWLAALSSIFFVFYLDDSLIENELREEILAAFMVLMILAVAILITFLVIRKRSKEMIAKPGTYLMPAKIEEKEPEKEEIVGKNVS